jgi:hypothetical protein
MAAGNRSKKGHPTDYVVHYAAFGSTVALCGKLHPVVVSGLITEQGYEDETCHKCLKKLEK